MSVKRRSLKDLLYKESGGDGSGSGPRSSGLDGPATRMTERPCRSQSYQVGAKDKAMPGWVTGVPSARLSLTRPKSPAAVPRWTAARIASCYRVRLTGCSAAADGPVTLGAWKTASAYWAPGGLGWLGRELSAEAAAKTGAITSEPTNPDVRCSLAPNPVPVPIQHSEHSTLI